MRAWVEPPGRVRWLYRKEAGETDLVRYAWPPAPGLVPELVQPALPAAWVLWGSATDPALARDATEIVLRVFVAVTPWSPEGAPDPSAVNYPFGHQEDWPRTTQWQYWHLGAMGFGAATQTYVPDPLYSNVDAIAPDGYATVGLHERLGLFTFGGSDQYAMVELRGARLTAGTLSAQTGVLSLDSHQFNRTNGWYEYAVGIDQYDVPAGRRAGVWADGAAAAWVLEAGQYFLSYSQAQLPQGWRTWYRGCTGPASLAADIGQASAIFLTYDAAHATVRIWTPGSSLDAPARIWSVDDMHTLPVGGVFCVAADGQDAISGTWAPGDDPEPQHYSVDGGDSWADLPLLPDGTALPHNVRFVDEVR